MLKTYLTRGSGATPDSRKEGYLIFRKVLLFDSEIIRNRFLAYMLSNGVTAIFHYLPLYKSIMGRKFGNFECPVTESVARRIVRLPFYNELSKQEQSKIINDILNF